MRTCPAVTHLPLLLLPLLVSLLTACRSTFPYRVGVSEPREHGEIEIYGSRVPGDTINVSWGDGTSDKDVSLPARHTYAVNGTYTIKVKFVSEGYLLATTIKRSVGIATASNKPQSSLAPTLSAIAALLTAVVAAISFWLGKRKREGS